MQYDLDWDQADREYRRAIALNPNYATAHAWYGEYLAFMGRFDEGLTEFARARELDPLSLSIATDVGKALYLARRYEQAVTELDKVLDVEPGREGARYWRQMSYSHLGRHDEALADHRLRFPQPLKASDDVGRLVDAVIVHAMAGRLSVAKRYRAQLAPLLDTQYVSPLWAAQAFAFAGDLDRGFEWLERT